MSNLSRREFLRTAAMGAAAAMLAGRAGGAADDKPAKPNIILILSDDHGLDGVGCCGSDRFKGKTPHMDALAKEGQRFTQCYSMPLCGPSRCTLMLGRYGFHTGGLTNQIANLPSPKDEVCIAKLLKQAGYATCQAGKWRQMGAEPSDWGFDEFLTDPTAGGWYWKTTYNRNGQNVQLDKEVYCPDEAMKFALDFMGRHRDKPFFLYFPSHLVHGPIVRTPDTKGGDNLYDDNIAYLDKQVGQIVAEVQKLGLRERTVILFAGDNGTARASGTVDGKQIHGAKGSLLEGGSRVPLIASWPGTGPKGQVLNDLVDFSDFFPTLAELAGAKLPEGVTIDGRSFAPRLRGQAGQPREWIFVQLGARWYVREPGYKLTEKGELFDMSEAPFAEKPVPADAGEPATAARKRLQAVLDKLNPAGGKTVPPGMGRKADKAGKAEKKRKRDQAATPST